MKKLAYIGSIMLLVGVFRPLYEGESIIETYEFMGILIIGFSLCSIYLTYSTKYIGLIVTGLGSLIVNIIVFIYAGRSTAKELYLRSRIQGESMRLPEPEITTLVLLFGGALLLIAVFIKKKYRRIIAVIKDFYKI